MVTVLEKQLYFTRFIEKNVGEILNGNTQNGYGWPSNMTSIPGSKQGTHVSGWDDKKA